MVITATQALGQPPGLLKVSLLLSFRRLRDVGPQGLAETSRVAHPFSSGALQDGTGSKVDASPGGEAVAAATEMSELCSVCSGKPGQGLKKGSVGGDMHFWWVIDGAVRVGPEEGGAGRGSPAGR